MFPLFLVICSENYSVLLYRFLFHTLSCTLLSCLDIFCSTVKHYCSFFFLFFFSLHLGICSGMNVCSYACFIFILENRRVKETCLMLELELICLWNKLPQETKFIKQTLCRSFVSCRLKKVVGKNITPAANLLGMPGSWGCVRVCFRDRGGKALLTEYAAGEGEKGTYWIEVLFVEGSLHCCWTNFNSFGHLRNFPIFKTSWVLSYSLLESRALFLLYRTF